MARGIIAWILSRVAPGLFKVGQTVQQAFSLLSPSVKGLTLSQTESFYSSWKHEQDVIGLDFTSPLYSTYPIWAMVESDNKLKRRYLLTFEASVTDRDTGELKTVTWQSYAMAHRSASEWENQFRSIYVKKQDQYKVNIDNFRLIKVTHAAGWSYDS